MVEYPERTDLENAARAGDACQQMEQLPLRRRHVDRRQPAGFIGIQCSVQRVVGTEQVSRDILIDTGPGEIAHSCATGTPPIGRVSAMLSKPAIKGCALEIASRTAGRDKDAPCAALLSHASVTQSASGLARSSATT